MTYVVRNDPNGFPRLYQITIRGMKAASPPCLTRTAALLHQPQPRK